ncbi:glucose repression mediator protein [Coemansia interrupta]|uniref:Glucose repression mediator protein n=1 Tax=Coemansia interrupta TaxID=1126814 RepID=A0A9W8HJC4_9FUNG|nr:glucose repression mediator protein [Coemansia interrupta]
MQAPHQSSQRSHTPGRMHQQSMQQMQSMSAGMAPPGMHVAVQMGHPPGNPNSQPNGAYQQMSSRGPPPHQGPPQRQSRQPMPPHQGSSQPMQPQPGSQQQQQQAHQPPIPPQQQMPPQGQPQQQQQSGQQQPPPPPQSHQQITATQRLSTMTEESWMQIGALSELMNEPERALAAYDSALRHNPYSQPALTQIANIYRAREEFDKAVDFFQRIVHIDATNGEIWGAIGNCYLMLDELPKAYQAYQQAIIHLPNPKEPKLWYGIGILYDRYGSYDHAEEAFNAVMNMDPGFEKATEIYFRLGIIHKCQNKYAQSLECFNRILSDPPKPLTETDIWFQIGNVHELNSEFSMAKDAYERVLQENPQHGKVLQQLGALYFRPNTTLSNIDAAVQLLMRAIEVDSDKAEAHTWYLLGRCYMVQRQYNKAYEAYQQAVYRDGNNANYWCSIGVLYYQINQYRDALDAYSRAIRINPYLSEVWFDLGALYEACNNQVNDAIDAYTRAAELDRTNAVIEQRLELLRRIQSSGQSSLPHDSPPPPPPVDPPIGPTSTGQPNAPGGPAGESAIAGGAPGSLGQPPMSGALGSSLAPPPAEHGHHPNDPVVQHANQHQQQRGPGSGPMSVQPPGPSANMPPQQQQQQQQPHPQYAQQSKTPQYPAAPGGRPGYPEDGVYGRYDASSRPESRPVADGQGHPPQYQSHGPPGSGSASGGAYPSSAPYSGAPYPQSTMAQQHPASAGRPYSTTGHPSSSVPYAPHSQSASTGPHRSEDVHMASRHHSPVVTQQPRMGQNQRNQQSTPVTDQGPLSASGSAFHQAQPPVNGSTSFSGPPSAAPDGYGHSRSPSRLQSPSYRQQQSQAQAPPPMHYQHSHGSESDRRTMRDGQQIEYTADGAPNGAHRQSFSRHDSIKAGNVTPSQPQQPQSASRRSDTRGSFSGDRDGDVAMADTQYSAFKAAALRDGPGAVVASAAGGASVVTASSAILPQVTTPAPPSDLAMSSSSTPALSGPTTAPMRLPPVQVGGGGGSSSSSFSAVGPTTQPFSTRNGTPAMLSAVDEGSKPVAITNGSHLTSSTISAPGGTQSLATAISASDEDKEGSAINSLMSLSNVATALTPRPQLSSPVAGKSATEAVVTSVVQDAQRDDTSSANGAPRDGGIASPSDSVSNNELAAAAATLKVSEENGASADNQSADGANALVDDSGERSGRSTPLALALAADTSSDQVASLSISSSTSSATASSGVAALVPSKRSLSAAGSGDAVISQSATPDNVASTSGGGQQPSEEPSGASMPEDAGGLDEGANRASSHDGEDIDSDESGPRKRGRQYSPEQSLKAEMNQSTDGAPAVTTGPSAKSATATTDGLEEGEEPEDGEIEDEPSGGDATKSHTSEDIVMDSGKV